MNKYVIYQVGIELCRKHSERIGSAGTVRRDL